MMPVATSATGMISLFMKASRGFVGTMSERPATTNRPFHWYFRASCLAALYVGYITRASWGSAYDARPCDARYERTPCRQPALSMVWAFEFEVPKRICRDV